MKKTDKEQMADLQHQNSVLKATVAALRVKPSAKKQINKLKEDNQRLQNDLTAKTPKERNMILKKLHQMFTKNIDVHELNMAAVHACGVYLLIKGNEVVYVGQSVNIPSRVGQHVRAGKKFDRVRFLVCEKDQLNLWEGVMINLLRPKLNSLERLPVREQVLEMTFSTTQLAEQVEFWGKQTNKPNLVEEGSIQ